MMSEVQPVSGPPAKIVKEGVVERDWKSEFRFTFTLEPETVEQLRQWDEEIKEQRRTHPTARSMFPWEERKADIEIEATYD